MVAIIPTTRKGSHASTCNCIEARTVCRISTSIRTNRSRSTISKRAVGPRPLHGAVPRQRCRACRRQQGGQAEKDSDADGERSLNMLA
jgi:hypothetical protein